MSSIAPSLIVLGLVACAAAYLALHRRSPPGLAAERARAARALAVATLAQSVHFAEELATGFHVHFPALFGLEPMPLSFFLGFNLAWIALWIASIPLLCSARAVAFFAAWFLAIGGMLNGIAHPGLTLASGGYFPGLFTSPLVAIAGIALWRRLSVATPGSDTVREKT